MKFRKNTNRINECRFCESHFELWQLENTILCKECLEEILKLDINEKKKEQMENILHNAYMKHEI